MNNRISNIFCRTALAAVMMVPFAVSCEYDDTEIREQIDLIIDKVYELEDNMNSELQALRKMINGLVTIKSIETNDTGVKTITLSDGDKLLLYPKEDLKAFVTFFNNSEGVACWAYVDENGKKQPFMIGNELLPVNKVTPEVVVEGEDAWIVFGEHRFPLSGNSVFSDYELVQDEISGEVYAVTFTFGEDMSFTVTVDGAAGFLFVKDSGENSTAAISDFYVAYGQTGRVKVQARGVVDYLIQEPSGWKVAEYEDEDGKYFDITAPSFELVAGGAAADGGKLKVMSVLEGGKAAMTTLHLFTSPFDGLAVSLGKADIKMRNGLEKYVYGVCEVDAYDESSIISKVQRFLQYNVFANGYGVSTTDISKLSLNEFYGKDLVPYAQYVLWAMPVFTDGETESLKEGTFTRIIFEYSSIDFEIGNVTNRDAELKMNIQGINSYYFDVLPKAGFSIDAVVANLNTAGHYTERTENFTYTGSAFELAGVTSEQETEYVTWVAVAGKTSYTAEDVIVREFATLGLLPGSDVVVTGGEMKVTAVEIEMPLAAAGADMIYYTFIAAEDAASLKNEEQEVEYIFENCNVLTAESGVAKASEVIVVKPESDYIMMAVASDANGKYGKVFKAEAKTKALVFNDLEVKLALVNKDPGKVAVTIAADGAESFLYWIGKTSENTWNSNVFLGGSAEKAELYMYGNHADKKFTSVMAKYPIENGTIKMPSLELDVEYVVVAMAKDADGNYSHAKSLIFTTNPVHVGKIVLATDSGYAAATPVVTWLEDTFEPAMGFLPGHYAFTVLVPAGFTAYVLAGSEGYFTGGVEGEETSLSVEEKIISIMVQVDRPVFYEKEVSHADFVEYGYPYGHEFYQYEHGAPGKGSGVIWESKAHHDKDCNCMKEASFEKLYTGVNPPVPYTVYNALTINDNEADTFVQGYATGSKTEVMDRVYIVCQDSDGNCYQAFEKDVPFELFAKNGEDTPDFPVAPDAE